MKDIMEIARLIKSRNPEEAHKEIFDVIKGDKQTLAAIVNMYVEEILPDVIAIKNIVHEYQNPVSLDGATDVIPEKEEKK